MGCSSAAFFHHITSHHITCGVERARRSGGNGRLGSIVAVGLGVVVAVGPKLVQGARQHVLESGTVYGRQTPERKEEERRGNNGVLTP